MKKANAISSVFHARWAGRVLAGISLLISLGAAARPFPPVDSEAIRPWVDRQSIRSIERIFDNIRIGNNIEGSHPGSILASPGVVYDGANGESQNYRFHWVRDGALVIRSLVALHGRTHDLRLRSIIAEIVTNYIDVSKIHQSAGTPGGLGEPKFHVDGRPFLGSWGRPQNDGPALRGLTLMDWFEQLKLSGDMRVARRLFDEVILPDLEYTLENVFKPSFEVWEEVYGHHFYVLLLQTKTLERGAAIARTLNRRELAETLERTAMRARFRLESFRDDKRSLVIATKRQTAGTVWYKLSNLDTSVIMASLLTNDWENSAFAPTDPWILNTAEELRARFEREFPINQRGYPGILMGRYPEDRYFGGNPWPIATLQLAELYFTASLMNSQRRSWIVSEIELRFWNRMLAAEGLEPLRAGEILSHGSYRFWQVIRSAYREGNRILARVRYHMGEDGHLFEQFHRDSGYLTALPHLSWSHAALLDSGFAFHAADEKFRTLWLPDGPAGCDQAVTSVVAWRSESR